MKNQILTLLAVIALVAPASVMADDHEGEAENPCNPCAPAENPCAPAENPCAPAEEAATEEVAEEEGPSYELQGWLDQEIEWTQDDGSYGLFEIGFRMGHAINKNYGGSMQINGRWDQTLTLGAENNAFSIAAREAYGYWQNDDESMRIQAGKWFVPIGFELADPPDLYQYSNSNQFSYFLPTEAIGLISYMTFSDNLDLALYLAGPTDDDFSTGSFKNLAPTLGERLGISFGDAGVGLSVVLSDNDGNATYNSILADVDFAAEIDDLTLGGEVSILYDTLTDAAGETMDYGVMAMASYAANDWLILTGRVDFVGGDFFTDPEIGITGAGLFNLADGFDLVLEVREDINDTDLDTGAQDTTFMGAFELIYQFL